MIFLWGASPTAHSTPLPSCAYPYILGTRVGRLDAKFQTVPFVPFLLKNIKASPEAWIGTLLRYLSPPCSIDYFGAASLIVAKIKHIVPSQTPYHPVLQHNIALPRLQSPALYLFGVETPTPTDVMNSLKDCQANAMGVEPYTIKSIVIVSNRYNSGFTFKDDAWIKTGLQSD